MKQRFHGTLSEDQLVYALTLKWQEVYSSLETATRMRKRLVNPQHILQKACFVEALAHQNDKNNHTIKRLHSVESQCSI